MRMGYGMGLDRRRSVGGSPEWTLGDLAPLFWGDSEYGVTDTSGVASWADRRDPSLACIQTTEARRPPYLTDAAGPYVHFDGDASLVGPVSLAEALSGDQPYTLLMAADSVTLDAVRVMIHAAKSGAGSVYLGAYFPPGQAWGSRTNDAATQAQKLMPSVPTGGVWAVRYTGSALRASVNRAFAADVAASGVSTLNLLRIGATVGSAYYSSLFCRQFAIWNRALSDAEILLATNTLCTKYGYGLDSLRVTCSGNSLTLGTGQTPYPTQLATLLDGYTTTISVINSGVNGRTTPQMIADYVAQAGVYNSFPRSIMVAWECLNDMHFGATPAEAAANMWAYCDMARAAGYKVLVANVIASAPAQASAADIAACNALLAAGWGSHADGFIDLAAASELSDYTDTDYFLVDGVHLNTDGYAIVAGLVDTAVRAVTF